MQNSPWFIMASAVATYMFGCTMYCTHQLLLFKGWPFDWSCVVAIMVVPIGIVALLIMTFVISEESADVQRHSGRRR